MRRKLAGALTKKLVFDNGCPGSKMYTSVHTCGKDPGSAVCEHGCEWNSYDCGFCECKPLQDSAI